MRAIHRWPVNSPHKGPITRKMFPFDDVIMTHQYGIVMPCFVVVASLFLVELCDPFTDTLQLLRDASRALGHSSDPKYLAWYTSIIKHISTTIFMQYHNNPIYLCIYGGEYGPRCDKYPGLAWKLFVQAGQPFQESVLTWPNSKLFNTLRSRQNEYHFQDSVFKSIFLHEYCSILIRISLNIFPRSN